MKKFFALFLTCVFAFFLVSCSAFESESGSVAVVLPGSNSARSVSTGGSIPPTQYTIEAFEIRVRNSDNKMTQKVSGAAPGSTIYIDGLLPDTYTISVLAYESANGDDGDMDNPRSFTYDRVNYYGKASVTVNAGESKDAAITIGKAENTGSYPVVELNSDDETVFSGIYTCSCTVTGNGVNFTYTSSSSHLDPNYLDGIPNYYWNYKKETFLEPGFDYTFKATVTKTDESGVVTYSGSKTVTIEQSSYGDQNDHKIYITVK